MKYEIYPDIAGFWRWRLLAANGRVLASGEGYYNKLDCLTAIQLVKNSSTAEVHG